MIRTTFFLNQLEPISRERNKIDSVHTTIFLQERNLTRETIEEILRYQFVRAPEKLIRKVKNTMMVYEKLSTYNHLSQHSFKTAYGDLTGTGSVPVSYRSEDYHFYLLNGRIGTSVPVKELNPGLKELFHYLRHSDDPVTVKGCICHYAIQYYQPFDDDNEMMSRLGIINNALTGLLESCRRLVRPIDRIRYFYTLQHGIFTRKDYMLVHKNISMSTAGRDLDWGVDIGFFERHGSNNQTTYTCCRLLE